MFECGTADTLTYYWLEGKWGPSLWKTEITQLFHVLWIDVFMCRIHVRVCS